MDTVHTYEVGRDIQWKDGRLALEFEGNRIDAIAGPGEAGSAGAAVLIDGKKPSDFREGYAFTRAYGPGMKVLCVLPEKTPLVEDWTLRVTAVDHASKSFSFEAMGSKTGSEWYRIERQAVCLQFGADRYRDEGGETRHGLRVRLVLRHQAREAGRRRSSSSAMPCMRIGARAPPRRTPRWKTPSPWPKGLPTSSTASC